MTTPQPPPGPYDSSQQSGLPVPAGGVPQQQIVVQQGPSPLPGGSSWGTAVAVWLSMLLIGAGIGYFLLPGLLDGDDAVETAAQPEAGPTGTTPVTNATLPIESCRLAPGTGDAVGLAFPRSDDRLPAVGRVDVAVLFADYADVPADRTPDEALALIAPESAEFFAAVSYGRMELVLHPHLEWLRLGPSADYASAIRSFDGHRDFILDAVTAADPDVDFSGMEAVVVIGTPNATQIGHGPTWMGFDGSGGRIDSDGSGITNGITSGADLTTWGWKWLPHEMGHSLGLPDLYMTGVDDGFTRPFGIMDDISGTGPEYFAYERWYVGWLDDDQVLCLDRTGETLLSPIEIAGGVKAIMVPLSGQRAVVVESRRALGYDTALAEEGALVYVVDVSVPTFEGPIRVKHGRRPLQSGESITVEGVTITVVDAAFPEGDTVRVTVDP